jgi:hypothetical protein
MRRAFCLLVAVASLTALSVGEASAARPSAWSPTAATGSVARFEGRWIDLRGGWGQARSCLIYPGRAPECFRTTAEMKARAASLEGSASPDLSCSTPLTLHAGQYQGGATLLVYVRGLWVNLSTYSFDNRTSSFTVGACAAELAAQSGGNGNHYQRCLYAGCVEDVMAPGWDNVVSSVYLH